MPVDEHDDQNTGKKGTSGGGSSSSSDSNCTILHKPDECGGFGVNYRTDDHI